MPEAPLPHRPVLRDDIPLLWRRAGTGVLGDHPHARDLNSDDLAFLRRLDGQRTLPTLLGDHPRADALLAWAHAAGALEDAAVVAPGVQWAQPSDRDLARVRARAAADTGLVISARDDAHVAVIGTGLLAEALTTLLPAAGLALASGRRPVATLTVLADAPHPRVPRLLDHDPIHHPHVHAAARGARGTVGPLVVPGLTSCLRCAHLHDVDRDPAWPLLAVQWAQQPPPPADPLVVHAVAVATVALVRRHVDRDGVPGADANRAFDLALPDLTLHERPCPPHPLCGCAWDADARIPVGAGTMAGCPTSPASA